MAYRVGAALPRAPRGLADSSGSGSDTVGQVDPPLTKLGLLRHRAVPSVSCPETAETPASFEEVVKRLEEVVDRLERGDLPLDASLAAFEEGVRLARDGARRLDEAERRVEQLLDSSGAVTTRPLADG